MEELQRGQVKMIFRITSDNSVFEISVPFIIILNNRIKKMYVAARRCRAE